VLGALESHGTTTTTRTQIALITQNLIRENLRDLREHAFWPADIADERLL